MWIRRDLIPAPARTYSDAMKHALLANDMETAARLAKSFQDDVIKRIHIALAAIGGPEYVRERLALYMSPPRALDDLREVLGILKARDALAALGARLPPRIASM